ncbi:MAG: helix-turn-helix domain-containing protein [Caldilineaceae bacterium]|nr:helix-turn-helix domain-containing protein [Caldilineaceae bacterium]
MRILSTGEVARLLQVSRETVRKLCADGKLRTERMGDKRGWRRIYADSLLEYAQEQGIRLLEEVPEK